MARRFFGDGATAAPLDAALINGTGSHALDFDDCSNTMGGHPSAPIVPALLALAEREGVRRPVARSLCGRVRGRDEDRPGGQFSLTMRRAGIRPRRSARSVRRRPARACSTCRQSVSLRLSAIAASMASGLKANFGTMTKPFHVGHCARNGLLAALLAAEGMTANPRRLEDAQGFFNVYNGPGTFDADKLLEVRRSL